MTRTQINVLLIEDNPADVLLLKESLSSDPLSDFHVTVVEHLKQGLGKLAVESFDVLLLDLGLPDSQGLETFETAHAQFFNIPIIVLSGMTDDLIALQAVQAGAQDYLVKGETGWNLGPRAIRYAIERHQSQMARIASEKRFSAFFHSSPMATAIARLRDGCILEINEAWCQFVGYSQEDIIGRQMNSLNIWADPKKQMEFVQLMKRDGKVHEFESQMKRQSGEIRDVLFSAEMIEVAGEPSILSMAQDITERKQNEKKIQEQERFIRATFDSLPEQICVLDENYKIISTNLGWRRFASENDHPQDDFRGVNYLSVCRAASGVSTKYAKQFADGLEAVMQGEIAEYSLGYPCDSPTEKRWFIARILPFPGKGPRRLVISHTNITALKIIEEALRSSEERYRIVTGLISDYAYSFRFEPNGQVIYEWVTDGFIRINGYTIEEVAQRGGTITLVHPDDLEIANSHINTLLQNHADTSEFRIINKDGTIHWLRNYAQPFLDEASEKVIRIYGSTQDITEQKLAEEALKASELRFRALIEHGMDNISLIAPDGSLLWENPAAVHMLGYSYDQFKGRNIFELVHPDDMSRVQKQFAEVLGGAGNVAQSSFRLKHSNDTWRWVEGIGTNLLHEPSVGAIVINYRDVTERKQAEHTLQMRTEDLALTNSLNEAANRGESIDGLVSLFAEKIESMIPSYRGASIYLFDSTGKNLELRGITISASLIAKIEKLIGRPIPKLDIPLHQGSYFQKLLEREQGTIISDPETLKQWIAEFTETTFLPSLVRAGLRKFIPQIYTILNITSVITIPLISSGKAIGLLDVSSEAVLTENDLKRVRDISSQVTAVILRKQTDEAFSESKRLLQTVIDTSPMRIFWKDTESRYLGCNPAFALDAGKSHPKELIGVNDSELIWKSEAELYRNEDQQVMNSGIPKIAHEELQVKPDGQLMWIRSFIVPLRNNEKQVIGVLGVYEDITERKQSEEQLRQSQLRLQMAFNAVKMGIHEWDVKADQLIWDDRMREFWELPSDAPLSYELFMQGIHPEDRDRVGASIRQLTDSANDNIQMIEYRVIGTQTGVERWLELKGKMYFTGGQPNRLLGTAVDITERKHAEQALQQSHEMLAKLTAQVPGVVYQYRLYPDGHSAFPFASPGMNNIYEVPPEEVQEDATPVFGRLHPDDASRVTENIYESARTLQPFHCEFRVVLPKQGLRWRLSNALPERMEDGGTLWYGIISDITERKEAEEVLRKSEDRFRSLFENAPVGVMLTDTKGNILEVNPSALRTLGSPSAEATRQINILTFPPLINSGISADFQKCVQTVQLITSEHPYLTKWGKSINLNLRFTPLVDTEGKLLLLQILIEDITARKEAERAVQESQLRYRALFEDSPLAIWEEDFSLVKNYVDELNETGITNFREYFASHHDEVIKCIKMINVLDVNSAALKMYQAPSKESLIENTLQTLCAGEVEHNMEDFIAIAEGRKSNSWDGVDERMTGESIEISLTWSVVPGYEHDFSKVIVTTVDITERKQAEALIYQYANELELRVEERTAELVHASRAKDEFLANMSHELRTPLNGILGFSETLLEGIRGPLNEKQAQAVEIIQSSGQHLLGLINDILDVSKIESGKFEVVPETIVVNDICRSSLNFIKQMANKKSIRVEYISQPAGATLTADPKRLKQILVNLLNNAVKFTPENGSIKLEVQADSSANMMRFSITDTGIGIAPENQKKLFKPFIQVDSSLSRLYEGTGLGLSLVKKLVEMQGGSVELKSEIGKGSCFTFTLPWQQIPDDEKHNLEQTESSEHQATSNPPSIHHIKVLLADDNESNIMMVRDYLESRRYQVRIAYNGNEAIREADEFLPDIVLMDIQMPHMNGFEATRHLRADPRFVSVPIIALTAFAMSGDRERCLEAGMNEYLSKPVKLRELSKMIEYLLEQASNE